MTVIVKVCQRKDKIKYLIIPKKSEINAGDYVLVSKDLSLVNKKEAK